MTQKLPKDSPRIGILEWFHLRERDHVERALDDLEMMRIKHLRTGFSWADWMRPDGRDWYEWLIPTLAERVEVLPCFTYTPPSLGEFPGSNAPPRRLEDYADFVCQQIELFGDHFEWVELWNEPDNHREWAAAVDPDYRKFATMIGNAAKWARKFGKKTLLGGLATADPNFLSLMGDHGALEHFDAVGVHGFPFSFEFTWEGWTRRIQCLRERLDWCGSDARIWITEAGYSTWRHDEQPQLAHFLDAVRAPVDRVYWYSLVDLAEDHPTIDGFHSDEREYHFGLKTHDGREKLLGRLWRSYGLNSLPRWNAMTQRRSTATRQKVDLVIGGAGFIGTNVAERLCREGRQVLIYDNLSRPGVEENVAGLLERHAGHAELMCADVLDRFSLKEAMRRAGRVFHFAAQVAVTTSLESPQFDFEVNAQGTFNVLEAARAAGGVPLLFTSTNKVYGGLEDLELVATDGHYYPVDEDAAMFGISEERPLDFHSPYGCSKGAADQYVLDYARCMGVPTVVFRMSCIYGPHQRGTEDQGWVAHFARAVLSDEPITLYGDGRQVRDVLFVEDLVDAMLRAHAGIKQLSGRAFNIGGGPSNAASLLEVLAHLERATGHGTDTRFSDWRRGDQRWYVSDHRRFTDCTGWRPTVGLAQGLNRLIEWQQSNLPHQSGVPVIR